MRYITIASETELRTAVANGEISYREFRAEVARRSAVDTETAARWAEQDRMAREGLNVDTLGPLNEADDKAREIAHNLFDTTRYYFRGVIHGRGERIPA